MLQVLAKNCPKLQRVNWQKTARSVDINLAIDSQVFGFVI